MTRWAPWGHCCVGGARLRTHFPVRCSKMYRWCLKKMKSRWLCIVTCAGKNQQQLQPVCASPRDRQAPDRRVVRSGFQARAALRDATARTTLRPLNCGSCGKSDANMRPTRCPRRVVKLFRISSGMCVVARPWPCESTLQLLTH